jgi:hypothetical protein
MAKNILSQSIIQENLTYDPSTGIFLWNKPLRGRRSNRVAGSVNPFGYVVIGIGGVIQSAHRLAWIYMHGSIPRNKFIDHINRDRSDNRIENLRLVSQKENNLNRSESRKKTEPRSRLKHVLAGKERLNQAINLNKKETQVLKITKKQQKEKKVSRLSKMLSIL